jgi:AcrR family transcriptional regulator
VRFLSERPFRELSVGQLMAGTTLSRPAFYQYFGDLHELMESQLHVIEERIGSLANPWLAGEGDPLATLRESLRGVVEVGAEHGTVLRAISEAAPYDARLERAWSRFMAHWDDAVGARIAAQQADGLVPAFDARAMANALNALNAAVVIQAFGRGPQADPDTVLDTLHRIWLGSLYARTQPPRPARRSRRRPQPPKSRETPR